MGRSSNEEAQRTRQRIVETASDLFRSKGADHVSLADLTAALGLTTGAFYRHFASKEALLAEPINWPSIAQASAGRIEPRATSTIRKACGAACCAITCARTRKAAAR